MSEDTLDKTARQPEISARAPLLARVESDLYYANEDLKGVQRDVAEALEADAPLQLRCAAARRAITGLGHALLRLARAEGCEFAAAKIGGEP